MITDTHLFWFFVGFFAVAIFSDAFLSLLSRFLSSVHAKSMTKPYKQNGTGIRLQIKTILL